MKQRSRSPMGLRDKVCVITGGGSGIGRSTALLMASEGATVALVGRTASKVESVEREVRATGGAAQAFAMDLADYDAVQSMSRAVLEGFGRIDVLVNNAGHSSPHRRLLTTTPEEIRSVIDSNLVGTIFCTQAIIPAMLEARQGTIINVSSLAGVRPGLLGGMVYSAAKAAVINFTEYINTEFKNTGIRASVVIPGEVDTPAMDKRPIPPAQEARATMVTADDVAEVITMVARLPQRTAIPELRIRPTIERDFSKEIGHA
jgi:NADP-dependent 3-hydroxy acid dehydrogenase YdfG